MVFPDSAGSYEHKGYPPLKCICGSTMRRMSVFSDLHACKRALSGMTRILDEVDLSIFCGDILEANTLILDGIESSN